MASSPSPKAIETALDIPIQPGFQTPHQTDKGAAISAGKYLTFQPGNEAYGIGILKVKEIVGVMPVTRMGKMPGFVRGLVNLRGKVIPVFDLRLKFGLESREDTERTCIILALLSLGEEPASDAAVTLGIIVDEVNEVVDLREEQIEPAPGFGTLSDSDCR